MSENSGRIKVSLVGAVALWIFARSVFAATVPASELPRGGTPTMPAPITVLAR